MDIALELRNIGKTFNGVNVLRNINLQVYSGEVHALLGENGAGKSTLIKILNGYHQPDKGGEILVNGEKKVFKAPADAMRASIHTIYQELTLCPDMTVAENIVIDKQGRFPGMLQDVKGYRRLAKEALDNLGLKISPDELVRNLSIAQQQVVEIAKALTANAKIILMDEPTSSISQKDADRLLELINNLKKQGVTIVYISHRLHEINKIADRITVLRDGNLVDTKPCCDVSTEALITMMVGREMTNVYPKLDIELGEVILKVENLTTDLFRDVSFEVRRGEIFGIGGLVGAKRTEILETLFGLRPIKSGKIYIKGKEYFPRKPKDAIKNKIAFVTEDRKKSGLVLCLPVMENLSMINAQFHGKSGYIDWSAQRANGLRHKESLNIKVHSLNQEISKLSGGNQQKVALGKWLDFQPTVLLFDEPTRGIDIGAKTEIYTIMGQLAAEGVAIIMVSSEMPELISVTDNILVMCEGVQKGILPHDEATQENIMKLAAVVGENENVEERA